MVILLKTLSHFEITFFKYNGKSIFWLFQILVPELENMHFHFHAFSSWGTSRRRKSVFKAFF